MGFSLPSLSDIVKYSNPIGLAYEVGKKIYDKTQVPTPPGQTSGPAERDEYGELKNRLTPQPDGTFIESGTGNIYLDNEGTTPAAAPNLGQQNAEFTSMSNYLNSLSAKDRDTVLNQIQKQNGEAVNIEKTAGDIGRQGENLEANAGRFGESANSFLDTINNPNAASVARVQLKQGLEDAQRQQLAAAAGVGGNNGFLASRNAANNLNNAALKTNQQAGLLRAGEVATAQGGLNTALTGAGTSLTGAGEAFGKKAGAQKSAGDLFTAAGTEANTLHGADQSTAHGYSTLAEDAEKAKLLAKMKADEGNASFFTNLVNTAGGVAASKAKGGV